MENKKRPIRFRTKYLIQPKFQLFFSGILIMIALLAALLVGGLIYLLVYSNNLLIVKYNMQASPEFLSLLAKQGRIVIFAWLGSFFLIAIVLLIAGVFLSHRMAGPIYALTREMKKIQAGDLSAHLSLRKRDEFKELKHPFNQWVESFRKMVSQDIDKIGELSSGLESLIKNLKAKNENIEDIMHLQKILDTLHALSERKQAQLPD